MGALRDQTKVNIRVRAGSRKQKPIRRYVENKENPLKEWEGEPSNSLL